MTRIKRLIDLYSFSNWFLIDILEWIGLCDRRVKEFKSLEVFCEYYLFCS